MRPSLFYIMICQAGKYYAINYPLRDGIDDECYESIFRPLITKIMEQVHTAIRPSAIFTRIALDSDFSGSRC